MTAGLIWRGMPHVAGSLQGVQNKNVKIKKGKSAAASGDTGGGS